VTTVHSLWYRYNEPITVTACTQSLDTLSAVTSYNGQYRTQTIKKERTAYEASCILCAVSQVNQCFRSFFLASQCERGVKYIRWDRPVSIVTRLRAGLPWFHSWQGQWVFFTSSPHPYRLWVPPSLLSNGYWVLYPQGEAAEVKNAWSYASTPPYVSITWCLIRHRLNLHSVDRNKFTFTFTTSMAYTRTVLE